MPLLPRDILLDESIAFDWNDIDTACQYNGNPTARQKSTSSQRDHLSLSIP
jgi:hypothetical protein